MSAEPLQPTAFREDPDIDELRSFFRPERHYAGDTRWSFGTSLKAAYVDSFEFLNHPPVVQLWRDREGAVQAVSRLSLGIGEWFHQSSPAYRTDDCTSALTQQADAAFGLLTDHQAWSTVRYEGNGTDIDLLARLGYAPDGVAEVHMVRPLDGPVEPAPCPPGVRLEILDRGDDAVVRERGNAQVDAFTDGRPTAAQLAWITRSLPHQLAFDRPELDPGVIAVDADGSILAFADVFTDRRNRIGEFEPVGTRASARGRGLAKAVVTRGLQELRRAGMDLAVVRTGFDNRAAIATYESVGFETTDRLIRFRRSR